jgi:hypothetical protein
VTLTAFNTAILLPLNAMILGGYLHILLRGEELKALQAVAATLCGIAVLMVAIQAGIKLSA